MWWKASGKAWPRSTITVLQGTVHRRQGDESIGCTTIHPPNLAWLHGSPCALKRQAHEPEAAGAHLQGQCSSAEGKVRHRQSTSR